MLRRLKRRFCSWWARRLSVKHSFRFYYCLNFLAKACSDDPSSTRRKVCTTPVMRLGTQRGCLGYCSSGARVSWFAKSTRFLYARTTAVHWRSTAVAWSTNGHSYYFWSEIVADLSFCFALLMIKDCDSFVRLFFVWSTRRLSFLSRILNIITT